MHPFCLSHGLITSPFFSPLTLSLFSTPAIIPHLQLEDKKKAGESIRTLYPGDAGQTEEEVKYSEVLSKIAEDHGVESITTIALACESFLAAVSLHAQALLTLLLILLHPPTLQTSSPKRPTSSP